MTVTGLPEGSKIKVVTGSDNDSALGALGISKLGADGRIQITLPERLAIWSTEGVTDINTECSDYQITMKILGDGRKLKANWNVKEDGSGITTNASYKFFKPAPAKSPFYKNGTEPFTIRMITNPDDESNKMLRIDEIKITAMCWSYSDPAIEASTDSGNTDDPGNGNSGGNEPGGDGNGT